MKNKKAFALMIELSKDKETKKDITKFFIRNTGVPDEMVLSTLKAYLNIIEEDFASNFRDNMSSWKEE
jgi:hypothetical protein